MITFQVEDNNGLVRLIEIPEGISLSLMEVLKASEYSIPATCGGMALCATCHVEPLFTEPGWNMHTAAEIGIDDFQANRSPDRRYRTAPLKGLWTHQKGGFYHDGRFVTLKDVVNHYDRFFNLGLTEQEKGNLIEYLLSL